MQTCLNCDAENITPVHGECPFCGSRDVSDPIPANPYRQFSDTALERVEPFGGTNRLQWWAEMQRRGLR